MSRVLRLAAAAVLVLLSALAVVPLVRLHTASPLDRGDAQIVADALPRLRFLREALEHGSAQRMQTLFPEGYLFSYALYGLTWVDVGARATDLRAQALQEARWALSHVDSDQGRAVFDASLDPPYGVFYQGWSAWLRGGVVRLAGADAAESARWHADVDRLAEAFIHKLDRSGSPFLEAYPGSVWPCDSAVGIAAVRLAGNTPLIARWLAAANARRDPATGLLPHTADQQTGQPTSGARATSQVIILRFLAEVDPIGAGRDWRAFRELFRSHIPGIPGIREYPHGTDLPGDVDSGPLILGLSASASAVALGDAVLYRDRPAAAALTGLAEATGFAVGWGGERRYLGGELPIGDAFLAWSLTARPWVGQAEAVTSGPLWIWRFPWYQLGLATIGPMLVIAAWLASRR